MAVLPAPKNVFIDVTNAVIDALIEGLGVELAISSATVYAPWLALPVISWIFRQMVSALADCLDSKLKSSIDIVIIRFTNNIHKGEYDDAIAKIKDPNSTLEDVEAARATLDRFIHRGS